MAYVIDAAVRARLIKVIGKVIRANHYVEVPCGTPCETDPTGSPCKHFDCELAACLEILKHG